MLKFGLLQMPTSSDKFLNLSVAEKQIKALAEKGAEVVVLPEIFNSPYDSKKFAEYAEKVDDLSCNTLSRVAKENKVFLVGGSIPEKEDNKIYNTCFIFDKEGKLIGKHRKMHLFDIDVKGGQKFKESDSLSPGNSLCVFDAEKCKIGVCICFDMRFPELARLLVLKGAKIIIVPAAFNMTTGPAHWELMFRQRAVDNQCYTIGCAPARNENAGYVSYANSMVVDPWGSVVYRMGKDEEYAIVDVDLSKVDSIRQQLPLLSARRNDIYKIIQVNENKVFVADEDDCYEIYYLLSKKDVKYDINDIKEKCRKGNFVIYKQKEIISCLLYESGKEVFYVTLSDNKNIYEQMVKLIK